MLTYPDIKGVIFDLDDTLLDNGPNDKPELWLHARSRLAAIHEVAQSHGIQELSTVTPLESAQAFITAPVHSLQGAVWNILYMKGLVDDNTIDPSNHYYQVVTEIAQRKNDLHESIFLQYGVEVPGATQFVRRLAELGLRDKMALATNAIRRDVLLFLDKYDLHEFFPDERIVSYEQVSST